MRLTGTFAGVRAGAVGSIAFIVACGVSGLTTDAPPANAASCDCPTPQSIESRIQHPTMTIKTNNTDTRPSISASCGVGKVLGGSCLANHGLPPLTLAGSARIGTSMWQCVFSNPDQIANVDITVTAICLMPEGTPPEPDAGP